MLAGLLQLLQVSTAIFLPTGKNFTAKEMNNLDVKKTSPLDDIAVKLLKLNNNIFHGIYPHIFSEYYKSIKPISSSLNNRKHVTKVNLSLSSWGHLLISPC